LGCPSWAPWLRVDEKPVSEYESALQRIQGSVSDGIDGIAAKEISWHCEFGHLLYSSTPKFSSILVPQCVGPNFMEPTKRAVRSGLKPEGNVVKQSVNQKFCKTSGHIEETASEDYTGEGKDNMNNQIPNRAFIIDVYLVFLACD
jgi:hypothetical protein